MSNDENENKNQVSNYSEFYYNYEESNLTIAEYYEVLYENMGEKQEFALFLQIGNFQTFQKMEEYLANFTQIGVNIFIVIVKEEVNEKNINFIKDNLRGDLSSCNSFEIISKNINYIDR